MEQNTSNTYTQTFTLSQPLSTQVSSNSAYVGFTGSDGGSTSIQTISNFSFTSATINVLNNVLVTADSTINLGAGTSLASLGALSSIGSNKLSITGAGTDTIIMGAATLTGNPTIDVASGQTLSLGGLNDGGAARTFTKSNSGILTLTAAAVSLVNGTQVIIAAGTLNSNNASALGNLAVVSLANGAIFSLGASQTVGGLSDYNSPPLNGSSVLLNGNKLTVGSTNNLSSTFSGVLSDGSSPGALTMSGTGTLTLGAANTYSGATTISAGTLKSGATNALPTATTLMVYGSGATFDLYGYGQQVAGLGDNGVNSGLVTNSGAAAAFTLNDGGTSNSFSGVIGGSLLALSKAGSGTLTLSGANTYSGGTTVSGGTLLVNNTSGSGTGAGTVSVSAGATLGGTGTISGAVTVATGSPGGTVCPGISAASTGILNTGSVTFANNSYFTAQLNGTAAGTQYDQLNVTGTVNLNSCTLNATLGYNYAPAVNDTLTIIKATVSVSGTFDGLGEGTALSLNGYPFKIHYNYGGGKNAVLVCTGARTADPRDLDGPWPGGRIG